MAQEAAPKEVANSTLRRLLAYSKSFNCTVAKIGDSVLPFKAVNQRSASRRRGPAKILDIDNTRVTVRFRGPTSKVARCCVREKMEEKGVADVE